MNTNKLLCQAAAESLKRIGFRKRLFAVKKTWTDGLHKITYHNGEWSLDGVLIRVQDILNAQRDLVTFANVEKVINKVLDLETQYYNELPNSNNRKDMVRYILTHWMGEKNK